MCSRTHEDVSETHKCVNGVMTYMNSTNLFDNINENFFNLLSSSSNNRLYSSCLITIYDIFEQEVSFKISRDVVRDTLATFIISENYCPDDNFTSVNDYANFIIRKFYDSGWLAEETDDVTYEKQVVMTESGVALSEFLIRLIEPPKTEYSSYVFNIYNLLKNRSQWNKNPYALALKPIYQDAKQLANSLKKLSTFIRNIIRKIVDEETLESLTKNLLSYCEGSFIKEYSRLVNENNIRIFRKFIISELLNLNDNADDYDLLVIGCYDNENFDNEEEAELYVSDMMKKTVDFLTDDYDRLMNDIQKKINIYLNLAVGRARFLLNHDDNLRGNVNQVIKHLVENADNNSEVDTEALFNIYTQEFIDMASLRFPYKQKVITTPTITEIPSVTDEDIEKARAVQYKEAYNPYSKKAMKRFVLDIMRNKNEISAEDFPINTKDDLLAVISLAAYCDENGFVLTPENNFIVRNGFIIKNFTISRRKESDNVQT